METAHLFHLFVNSVVFIESSLDVRYYTWAWYRLCSCFVGEDNDLRLLRNFHQAQVSYFIAHQAEAAEDL